MNSGCAPSLSLGTYIASIRNRSSCQDITEDDIAFARTLLKNCSTAYFNGKLDDQSVPQECENNKEFIKNVFNYLVDVDFMYTTNNLKATMVLSPAYYDTDFARDIYNQHLSGDLPERNGVKLVAFSFDNFKFDQFNLQLLLDAVFPVIGLVMVALILMLYTHSLVIMALTIFSVITSVIIAYFIYHQVFRLTFFPFLNILTFIFLVGIGADDAFVFNDVWSQAKLALPQGGIVEWTEYTLKHAALAMFVTSLTTSAAFLCKCPLEDHRHPTVRDLLRHVYFDHVFADDHVVSCGSYLHGKTPAFSERQGGKFGTSWKSCDRRYS